MKIPILKITFLSNSLSRIDVPKFRGFLANKYTNYNLIHNHLENGKLRYAYPQIQFKVIDEHPVVIGIEEGINILKEIFIDLNNIKIGNNEDKVFEKSISLSEEKFGITKNNVDYTFLSPWLALNESNYEKYQKTGMQEKRKELLENVLNGNILSLSKSLNYTVPGTIKAEIIRYREVNTSLKGVPMIGFLGEFAVNFELPEYIGLGKSVSRGFGTIKKIKAINHKVTKGKRRHKEQ